MSSSTTNITPQQISQVAHEEGGTTKGSKSAQMQSEYSKQLNKGPLDSKHAIDRYVFAGLSLS